MCEKVMDTGGF